MPILRSASAAGPPSRSHSQTVSFNSRSANSFRSRLSPQHRLGAVNTRRRGRRSPIPRRARPRMRMFASALASLLLLPPAAAADAPSLARGRTASAPDSGRDAQRLRRALDGHAGAAVGRSAKSEKAEHSEEEASAKSAKSSKGSKLFSPKSTAKDAKAEKVYSHQSAKGEGSEGAEEPGPSIQITDSKKTLEGSTTLYDIKKRGVLNCGITTTPGFGIITESENGENSYSGFDVDLCRSVAAAIFGEVENLDSFINYTTLTGTERFKSLQDKEVDMLARITTLTMDRDVWIPEANSGFSFSAPYIFDGHRFAGIPEFVECADNLEVESGNCASMQVCVNDGTTTLEQLKTLLPNENISIRASNLEAQMGIADGGCNVIFAGSNAIAEPALREAGYEGDYAVGDTLFSREPLALVTRESDPRFTDFVNWVLQALMSAEENNITQEEAANLSKSELFGKTFAGAFRSAVSAVGNYGEIYKRNLENLIPRGGLNTLNNGDSGRILSQEFGSLERKGPLPSEGTLAIIKRRGFVSCGITRRAGFADFDVETATWSGLDVDYCRALSAAIFDGSITNVVFHVLPATDRFQVLSSGLVDVLSRITTHTFERDVFEPSAQVGFTFSNPNFYDGLSFGGIPPFGNCADQLDTTSETCKDLRICVNDGTTTIARTRELFPEENILPMPSGEASLGGLASGACNAVAGGSHDIAQNSVASAGYTGDYEIGSNRFSKDPLAMVTRQDDPTWSDFVFWVLEATFYAEEQGIDKVNAKKMPTTNLFGALYRDMLRNAVQAVGNYQEIYARNVEVIVPRNGLNLLNDGNMPQHYSLPGIGFEFDK